MSKDNASAVVFSKMREDILEIKGDVDGLNERVGVLEKQPSCGSSSTHSVDSNSLYSTVRSALKDVLTERDNEIKKEYNNFCDAMIQREDQWVIRASNIADTYERIQKHERDIDNKLINIETSIKTSKHISNTGNSIFEITPFQNAKITFKSFFQKSFIFDPRVIILSSVLVMLVYAVTNMSIELYTLQDTKQKYEIMRNFYRGHKGINADYMFLDSLFADKDKNEEVIERMRMQNR